MKKPLSKRAINRQRWFDHIEAWQQSGLTQKAYCAQQHIGLASFQRWRGIVAKAGQPKAAQATLLPVNIVPSVSTPNLVLHLGTDLRIEIPAGFDPAMLTHAVRALQP